MASVVLEGDCLKLMQNFEANTFDAIVTDPPYGLSFMGKDWDHGIPGVHFWQECLRVSKPGTHMLAFGGTRTHHRLMVAIEDAGWEIRDCIFWVYGSGFPKSLDVSKAIDKAAGAERELTKSGIIKRDGYGDDWDTGSSQDRPRYDIPVTDSAKQWNGWGTSLKPAYEIIVLCRKPIEGTVAENVQKWGTGGINIDGCRVEISSDDNGKKNWHSNREYFENYNKESKGIYGSFNPHATSENSKGRFPANLIHDGSDEVLELFPQSKGQQGKINGTEPSNKTSNTYGEFEGRDISIPRNDNGSAARFFYSAKASKFERNLGLPATAVNRHPTIKPLSLLQYLCKLITPPNGLILDPFAGSGTTGIAASREGFNSVLMELEHEYAELAKRAERL